jgi:phosphoribosylamine--glycine ligase
VFAKDLMARHGIPTARFGTFSEAAEARRYCRELGAPLVVKADGLAAGKGAVVCQTLEDADRAIALCLDERGFGDAGRTIVVEEFMQGEEISFFVLSDGTTAVPFGAAQDHKTVFDGDRGPNTGGMGAYAPVPIFDDAIEQRVMKEIVAPTIRAMQEAGTPYQGVLYVGLMMTKEGPKVVEFNCRFGDPECQVIVPRLSRDLVPLLVAVADGQGLPAAVTWQANASVCVVLASAGYPGRYPTGLPIHGIDKAEREPGVNVFHAGTAMREGALVTAGGRVLGVQALGKDIAEATQRAYAAVKRIKFKGVHWRKDIGRKALARR